MRKPVAVILVALSVASVFAQEAANPKPAPERNNGAFVAIFCSLIAVGISVATAIKASKTKSQKAKSDSETEAASGSASE